MRTACVVVATLICGSGALRMNTEQQLWADVAVDASSPDVGVMPKMKANVLPECAEKKQGPNVIVAVTNGSPDMKVLDALARDCRVQELHLWDFTERKGHTLGSSFLEGATSSFGDGKETWKVWKDYPARVGRAALPEFYSLLQTAEDTIVVKVDDESSLKPETFKEAVQYRAENDKSKWLVTHAKDTFDKSKGTGVSLFSRDGAPTLAELMKESNGDETKAAVAMDQQGYEQCRMTAADVCKKVTAPAPKEAVNRKAKAAAAAAAAAARAAAEDGKEWAKTPTTAAIRQMAGSQWGYGCSTTAYQPKDAYQVDRVENVKDIQACQRFCETHEECQAFELDEKHSCALYDAASLLVSEEGKACGISCENHDVEMTVWQVLMQMPGNGCAAMADQCGHEGVRRFCPNTCAACAPTTNGNVLDEKASSLDLLAEEVAGDTKAAAVRPVIDWASKIVDSLTPSMNSVTSMILNPVKHAPPMRGKIKAALDKVGPMPKNPDGVSNEMMFMAVKEGAYMRLNQILETNLSPTVLQKKGVKMVQELFFTAMEAQFKDTFA